MEVKRRTQEERSAATRGALVDAARTLWAERGYGAVGTPEIAKAAGVTRGAMYHQFADKAALFLAVVEAVETDVTQRLVDMVAKAEPVEAADALRAAIDAWIDVSDLQEVRQIVLLDAPVVLGWGGFRDVSLRYALGLTEALLQEVMDAGQMTKRPTRALAHIVIGALDEAAMVVATSEDRDAAREEVRGVLHELLGGLLVTGE
jgi:AcrR family transcriptional regulator